jgi:hypothetical protein
MEKKFIRIVGIPFRLLVPFWKNHCQPLQPIPTFEHSDMHYLLMNDDPSSKLNFGTRNKPSFSIMMGEIIAQKLM